jgi:hypothetical protein
MRHAKERENHRVDGRASLSFEHGQKVQRWDMKNIGTIERVVRIALGGVVSIWALTLLIAGGNLIWMLWYIAVFALGADFVITGIRGYCPLYNWLGWSTAPPQAHG